jgi:hypothetical protein
MTNKRGLTMKNKLVLGTATAITLLAGSTGVAVATGDDDGDQTVGGAKADHASAAALDATGGGNANSVERDKENGATWEVEVTKPTGDTVDVRLDENYQVVVIEGDKEDKASKVETKAADDGDETVTGSNADRATAAALDATGGGSANSVERDKENGATWEVEVTKPTGDTVDVRLDENYQVVVIEGDREDANGS